MAAEPNIVVGLFDLGSGPHWLILLFIALLLFGRKLPEMMKGLGGSIRQFKKGMEEQPPEPPPPSFTQPPAPHIDGAVSRPADPPAEPHAEPHADPHAVPPVDAHPPTHVDPPVGHEPPVHPASPPDDPPKHH